MAPRTKRKALTTDDLLRRQEEPDRKRVKLSPPLSIQSDSDELSEVITGGDESEDENSSFDEEEDEETREDNLDDGTFDDGEESASEQFPTDSLNEPERFKFSRVKEKQIIPQLREKKLPDSFSAFGISNQLQSALTTMSIRTPTEVQAACIPPLLAGKSAIPNNVGIIDACFSKVGIV